MVADRQEDAQQPPQGGADATDPRNTEAILRLLGLARRAGALQLGATAVLRALGKKGPGVVFLARDAGDTLRRNVERDLGRAKLDVDRFDNEGLGELFGRQQLAVVSVHDPGFVSGLVKLMTD